MKQQASRYVICISSRPVCRLRDVSCIIISLIASFRNNDAINRNQLVGMRPCIYHFATFMMSSAYRWHNAIAGYDGDGLLSRIDDTIFLMAIVDNACIGASWQRICDRQHTSWIILLSVSSAYDYGSAKYSGDAIGGICRPPIISSTHK